MSSTLILALIVAAATGACGTSAPTVNTSLDPETGGPGKAPAPVQPAAPTYREVTIPSGTALRVRLHTSVASDTSRVEEPVNAELRNAVVIDGREVLPAGSTITGVVARADGSGRVKGRAVVALRFTSVTVHGERDEMTTRAVSRQAPATKRQDATKIGIGAGAGAVLGAILGGKKGAAEGAAVGGGAGTGVVLATKGKEVRLPAGAILTTALTAPLKMRVLASS